MVEKKDNKGKSRNVFSFVRKRKEKKDMPRV
jgi:hypothetical protein